MGWKIKQDLQIHKKMRYTIALVKFVEILRLKENTDTAIQEKKTEFLQSNPNDYYRPILAKHGFDENYEFYTC